jgi:hypothetical protein
MITRYVLPLLSVLGLTFAIGTVLLARPPAESVPVVEPPTRPTEFKTIAGSGLI